MVWSPTGHGFGVLALNTIAVAWCDREVHVKLRKRMKKITITCYRKTKSYPESQRKKMQDFYLEGMACCEGSEQERYAHIYTDLAAGKEHCFDEPLW